MAFAQKDTTVPLVKILHRRKSLFVNQDISALMELCIPALPAHTKMNKGNQIVNFVHLAIIAMQPSFLLPHMKTTYAHLDFTVPMVHSLIINIHVRKVLIIL